MTRETKIGLLVGLAFIIVIGILLSDHMTSTTDPPKAPLSVAGPNVRESVATPTSPGTSAAPVPGATAQTPVAPSQPVLTGAELQSPPRTPQTIQVGPGPVAAQQPAQSPIVVQQGSVARPQQPAPGAGNAVQPPAVETPVVITPPSQRPAAAHPLQQVATRHGEEIVPLDTGNAAQQGASSQNPPVPLGTMREYKAQSGDSLSKLASKFLGANSKTNREAIIRVNPTLQQNPDKIVVGRTYLIPQAEAAAATPPATPASARDTGTPEPEQARRQPAPAATQENFTWYTVKENDNLWRIASEQLGSGNATQQIRDLNQDVLKGKDDLRPNMKIRIPNKPVASVN